MQWLLTWDVELFRLINLRLINPVFDAVMPFVSGNPYFFPVLLVGAILLLWKGRARAWVCVAMLALVLPLGDGWICNNLKHAIGRTRPFDALPEVHRPGVKDYAPSVAVSNSPQIGTAPPVSQIMVRSTNSMPSSHAANWFAAAMIAFVFYRGSIWFMLPAALLVSFSRIYIGVHYPSDVLAGAILGAGYAAASVWSLNAIWLWAGLKWFPLWWQRMPSLWNPELREAPEEEEEAVPPPRGAAAVPSAHSILDAQWLRLGYIFIGALLLFRLVYLASGTIQLQKDEAYQWLWSKHLALSYYSKPPLIAYTQWLGTHLWGDTAFGVRFFSPVIAAIISLLLLRFFAREVNARAGFFLLLIITATPLASLGAVLMTVDPLSVLFWTAAMLAGWRAVQPDAGVRHWLWVGLWMGLGFLSKYTELFQLLCWAVFFALWPPARKHLRRPGPYLALLVAGLCSMPVLVWNAQHQWITVQHVANDAGVGTPWKPTLRYLGEFLGSEAALLNPVFFVATIWTAIAFWRRSRHNPRLVYFFSMGAPLFLAYLLHSFRSRVFPNWIAPSVLPLFCLMVIYWDTRWRLGAAKLKGWLVAGLAMGFAAVILAHNTDFIGRLTGGRFLPVNLDPLHRVRGWSDVGRAVDKARKELLQEGKPVFVITDDYELAGELSFYMPEARAGLPDEPLVYFRNNPTPVNQFFYWSGYAGRTGQNALFVLELDRDKPVPRPAPAQMEREFESVTDLGVHSILYHGRLCWPIQIFACRGLKPAGAGER